MTLAGQLATTPLRGQVRVAEGRAEARVLDGVQFLDLVVEADLSPGLAAELSAAVRAALRGEPRPLLRLAALPDQGAVPEDYFNGALFAATTCDDGPFPWRPETPILDRPALIDAATASLPPGATGPFGTWATAVGDARFCKLWPEQAAPAELAPLPLPDVPVLVLAGDRDTRTPVSGAAATAARFPQGQLLVVPGVGHAVLYADPSGCAVRAVKTWLADARPAARCQRAAPIVRPIAPFPRSLDAVAPEGLRGLRGRTLAAVLRTVREAGAMWMMGGASAEGLYGGRLVASRDDSFELTRYSIVPGVQLSGTVSIAGGEPYFPLRFRATIRVGGASAAPGFVFIQPGSVFGSLGTKKAFTVHL